MSAEWIVVVLGLVGILAQAFAAFLVVRVATAVLEEKLKGHKAITEERFNAHDEKIGAHEREIQRLRDWRHDDVVPLLQDHEGRIAKLESEED